MVSNMDLGNKTNLDIIKKYCLADGGCPKLKKCKDYTEKVQVCSQCIDKVYKFDMVEILRELYGDKGSTPTPAKPTPPTTGKGTEQSTAEIGRILDLYYNEGLNMNQIRKELHLQHLTVKNVINESFKNPTSNEKVRLVKEEMGLTE